MDPEVDNDNNGENIDGLVTVVDVNADDPDSTRNKPGNFKQNVHWNFENKVFIEKTSVILSTLRPLNAEMFSFKKCFAEVSIFGWCFENNDREHQNNKQLKHKVFALRLIKVSSQNMPDLVIQRQRHYQELLRDRDTSSQEQGWGHQRVGRGEEQLALWSRQQCARSEVEADHCTDSNEEHLEEILMNCLQITIMWLMGILLWLI